MYQIPHSCVRILVPDYRLDGLLGIKDWLTSRLHHREFTLVDPLDLIFVSGINTKTDFKWKKIPAVYLLPLCHQLLLLSYT